VLFHRQLAKKERPHAPARYSEEEVVTEKLTVAVLGAGGTMGFPIARNLARAGLTVRAWNRSREKVEPLSRDDVRVVDSPDEAADGSDVTVTMLADADPVVECARKAFGTRAVADGIWVQMSTIGEAGTERCSELARELGVGFVDAPVLGTKAPAEEAALVVFASGPPELHERAQPVFDAIARRTMWVGEAGAASRLKVATNSWILAVVEGTAETLALAEGLGLDPQLVLDAVSGGPLDLPYLQMKGRAIIEGDFDPSFKLALAAKDASLVEESARRHRLDLPLLVTIRRRMEEGSRRHGGKDMSATYLTSIERDPAA
jgi:3-hydroxyisobutyrate dehydrogenase